MEEHKFIRTSWGNELLFHSNNTFTAKKSECYRKYWSGDGSFIYHKHITTKSFFIIEGSLLIHIIEETKKGKKLKPIILNKDDSFTITHRTYYRFTAVDCKLCTFIEISTNYSVDDENIINFSEFKI